MHNVKVRGWHAFVTSRFTAGLDNFFTRKANMGITDDTIENMTGDLKNAMCDLLSNGPNKEDEKRIREAFTVLESCYSRLKHPDFHI
jgi:hypothetical protein